MVFKTGRAATACIGVVATVAWATPSFAEDGAGDAAPASQGITVTRTLEPNGAIVVERWPDRALPESAPADSGNGGTLIGSGVLTFGLSYIPAVVTASTSSLPVDKQLYVPVAGPWIDLANRPNCGARSLSCNAEIGNQALLIVDGFFQGLAMVQILAGLGALAHDAAAPVAKIDDKPSVHVRPAQVGAGGYGLAAVGRF